VSTPPASAWFWDEPAPVPGEHLTFEVVTGAGRAATVDLLVHPHDIEVWHDHHLAAAFDRDRLRDWLAHPDQPLERAEVVFDLDQTVDIHDRTAITDIHGRVAVTLPDVPTWPLSPSELDQLRRFI